MKKTILLLAISGFVGYSGLLQAGNEESSWFDKNVNIFGFASQTWTKTSGNINLYGNSSSSGGGWDNTVGSLNAYVTLRPELSFSTQLLYRDVDSPESDVRWDYAYFTYHTEKENFAGNIMVGRIKNKVGLYNATRDVAFTRPSIELPLLYNENVRSFLLSGDGIFIDGSARLQNIRLSGGYNYNKSYTDDTFQYLVFESDFGGDFTGNRTKLSFVGFDYESDDFGHVYLQYTDGYLSYKYKNGPHPVVLDRVNYNHNLDVLSLQWDYQGFQYTTEYLKLKNRGTFYRENAIKKGGYESQSYYHQLSYNINSKWSVLGRYDVYYKYNNDKNGKKTESATPYDPAENNYQKGFTLGLTWNIKDDLMIRGSFSYNEGYYTVSPWGKNMTRGVSPVIQQLTGTTNNNLDKYWTMFQLQASYKF